MDEKTVAIGFAFNSAGATNSFTGGVSGGNVKIGDGLARAKVVVDHINKSGGAGGRQIRLVPYERKDGRWHRLGRQAGRLMPGLELLHLLVLHLSQ